MKWIVTGVCGFIGTNLAERLARLGHVVVGIDNVQRPRVHANLSHLRDNLGIEVRVGDIRDRSFLHEVFREHQDAGAIAHLAGQVSYLAAEADPVLDFDTNALGTFNVCSAAREICSPPVLVYASTNKVYGDLASLEVREMKSRYVLSSYPQGLNESRPLNPMGAYASSKAAAELAVRTWTERGVIHGISLRQSSVYGGHQFPTGDQGWAAHFAERFAHNQSFTISGSGKQVRDLLHVSDLCEAYLLLSRKGKELGGRSLNIGGGQANSMSILELLEFLEAHTGNAPAYSRLAERPHDQRVFISDNSALQDLIPWSPRCVVAEGLRELVLWAGTLNSSVRGPVS